jgi:CRP/FNR family transcriptional regulator, cyclic AMP receptor protein
MNANGLGRTYADGETIVSEGEAGDCMFAIQSGRLEVVQKSKDGEVRLAVMEEGDVFGEMAIFEREVRSATVRALGEARVLTIDRRTFLRRMQEDPSLAFNLMQAICKRVRRLSGELAALKQQGRLERRRTPERRRGVERRSSGRGA